MRGRNAGGDWLFAIFTAASIGGIVLTWAVGTYALGTGVPFETGDRALLAPPRLQVALALTGLFALTVIWLLGRQLDVWSVQRDTGPVAFRPPDGLRPAQLGLLLDGEIDERDLVGSILDLAARRHVRIIDATGAGRVLVRSDGVDRLLPFEGVLLDRIFSTAGTQWVDLDGGRTEAIAVGQLRGRFAGAFEEVRAALLADALTRGWVRRHPDDVRWRWYAVGLTGLVGSLVAGLVLAITTDWVIVTVPVAAGSLVLLAIHPRLPTYSAEGRRMIRASAGFRRYVTTAETGPAAFADRSGDVTTYLGHVVAMGLVDEWVDRFGRISRPGQRRPIDATPIEAYLEVAGV